VAFFLATWTAAVFIMQTTGYAIYLQTVIINVAVNSVLFSLDGSQVALQELFPYRHSPFNLNVSQYFFIQQATHLFGAAAFSLLVLLLSVSAAMR
jgi:hypothetical protein